MNNLDVVNYQNHVATAVNAGDLPIAVKLSVVKNIVTEMEVIKAKVVQNELSLLKQGNEKEVKKDGEGIRNVSMEKRAVKGDSAGRGTSQQSK